MTPQRLLRIGIAPYESIKAGTLAVARGERIFGATEPMVWFTSLESLAQVLSRRNRLLLEMIARTEPSSVTDLARTTGRAKGNLSRTLRTLERYRLLRFERGARGQLRPRVTFGRIRLDIHLESPR